MLWEPLTSAPFSTGWFPEMANLRTPRVPGKGMGRRPNGLPSPGSFGSFPETVFFISSANPSGNELHSHIYSHIQHEAIAEECGYIRSVTTCSTKTKESSLSTILIRLTAEASPCRPSLLVPAVTRIALIVASVVVTATSTADRVIAITTKNDARIPTVTTRSTTRQHGDDCGKQSSQRIRCVRNAWDASTSFLQTLWITSGPSETVANALIGRIYRACARAVTRVNRPVSDTTLSVRTGDRPRLSKLSSDATTDGAAPSFVRVRTIG